MMIATVYTLLRKFSPCSRVYPIAMFFITRSGRINIKLIFHTSLLNKILHYILRHR